MWDYDKLFADGNIVGIKNEVEGRFGVYQITKDKELPREARYYNFGKRWDDFKNANLARSVIFIQYIIRLDEHGNVIEKLFDRETDMPKPMPELETGMFVRVGGHKDNTLGFIDAENNHIIYQDGGYDFIDEDKKALGNGVAPLIVEVYGKDTLGFRYCGSDELIWRSPEYQDYLDSKN